MIRNNLSSGTDGADESSSRSSPAEKTGKSVIVFIDDESAVLDGYRRMLRRYASAWEMVFQTDSRETLKTIRQTPPDVIVTDLMMPYVSGLQLVEDLQRDDSTKSIPIIVVTGGQEHDMRRRALDLGATDLLRKPVDYEDLVARIRNSLRLKAAHDELCQKNDELERRVRERTYQLRRSRREIIARLSKAAEYRDTDTGQHVLRVGHYSRLIALQMGLPDEQVEAIYVAAPLHDVGKIAIPDAILRKPGPLTDDERRVMQSHCSVGVQILEFDLDSFLMDYFDTEKVVNRGIDSSIDLVSKTASEIVSSHHEFWNGKGYPLGLSGTDIPISARIVSVADVFDALTTVRPYKPAFSVEYSIDVMRRNAGTQFDPDVFQAFLKVLPEILRLRKLLADEKDSARTSTESSGGNVLVPDGFPNNSIPSIT